MLCVVRDLSVLSDVEFEELAADLLAAELGRPVERFGVGRDGGVDLRWANPNGRGKVVGQCKHYLRSTFAQLRASAKRELDHVKTLDPAGYKFVTSFDLTVGQKQKLYEVFRKWMTGADDVIGGRDIDGLLTLDTRHSSDGTQSYGYQPAPSCSGPRTQSLPAVHRHFKRTWRTPCHDM